MIKPLFLQPISLCKSVLILPIYALLFMNSGCNNVVPNVSCPAGICDNTKNLSPPPTEPAPEPLTIQKVEIGAKTKGNMNSTFDWTVTYSEDVIVNATSISKVKFSYTGSPSPICSQVAITQGASANTAKISVSGCSTDGTVHIAGLDAESATAIKDQGRFANAWINNSALGIATFKNTASDNSSIVVFQNPALSKLRASGSATFQIGFPETMDFSAFDPAGIILAGSSVTIGADCFVSSTSRTANTLNVEVSGCSYAADSLDSSIVGISSLTAANIRDDYGNLLENLKTNSVIKIDNIRPAVTITDLAIVPHTAADSFSFKIQFTDSSEIAQSGLAISQITLLVDGGTSCTVSSVAESGPNTHIYQVNATGCQGNGQLTIGVTAGAATDIAGNLNAVFSNVPGINITNFAGPLIIAPVYPMNAPATTNADWGFYVRNNGATQFESDGTACDGSETGKYSESCIHRGEKRKAIVPGRGSCTGLTAEDSLKAFHWLCRVVGPNAVFFSSGFKSRMGLRNLLQSAAAWKLMSLTVYDGASPLITSTSEAWWANPVLPFPANSSTLSPSIQITTPTYSAGTIFVLASSNFSAGYEVQLDNTSIVTLASSSLLPIKLKSHVNAANCKAPGSGSLDSKCLIWINGAKFAWIDGQFQGDDAVGTPSFEVDYDILLTNSKFSRIENVTSYRSAKAGIALSTSNSNLLKEIHLAYHGDGAVGVRSTLLLESSANNVISEVSAMSSGYGASSSESVVTLNGSSNNILSHIHVAGSSASGIGFWGNSNSNVLSHASLIGLSGLGTSGGLVVSGSNNNNFSQILSANNSVDGILLQSGSNTNVLAQIIAQQNPAKFGISDSSGGSVYKYGLMVDSCNSGGGSPGISNTCTNQGTSSANITTTTLPATAIFGKLNEKDPYSLVATTTGTATSASLLQLEHYLSFLNPLRFFGLNTTWGTGGGLCQSGSCGLWDLRVSDSPTPLRNMNGIFIPGLACPNSVDGNVSLVQSNSVPYLVNASEIIGDSVGNENGLCESNERCAYSPHIGGYQGPTEFETATTCGFSDGAVSGVTMYRFRRYAELDPIISNGTMTITNDGTKLAKTSSPGLTSAMSNIGKKGGKWYFEVKVLAVAGSGINNSTIGFGVGSTSTANYVGAETGANISYGYDGSANGTFYTGSSPSALPSGNGYGINDVIQVAVDFDSTPAKMWFGKNGTWINGGSPSAGTFSAYTFTPAKSLYPMATIYFSGTEYEFNFGKRTFHFAAPTGFNSGWYDD